MNNWCRWLFHLISWHYQKINKYKWKYRGNIFVGKLQMDFTHGNISSIFWFVFIDFLIIFPRYLSIYRGNYSGKKIIKTMMCHFYQWNYRRNLSLRYNSSLNSLVNCEHYLLCQLQKESPTANSVGIFQRALKLFTSHLHF